MFGLLEYPNVSPLIGALLSTKMATMAELDHTLSTEDAYDLMEIAQIDAYNRSLAEGGQ